jgi:lysozyme
MKMTEEGLALIRQSEGLRLESYRDAVGVWTIGYGHTSAAGAPEVVPGQHISREEANAILRRDVEAFADGVRQALSRRIGAQQFSALVSFAYNVGLGAFRRSSVLNAVNAGEDAAVPQRLSLWVKAGGRRLPGLVKRRAAEAALYMQQEKSVPPEDRDDKVSPASGTPAHRSTTVWAAVLAAVTIAFNELARFLGYGVIALSIAAALIAAAWIIRERLRKSRELGV